jgi:hypothetical protein
MTSLQHIEQTNRKQSLIRIPHLPSNGTGVAHRTFVNVTQ